MPGTRDIRLIGGRPCLDFVNTVHSHRARAPDDYWPDARRYMAWAVHAGLLTPRERAALRAQPGALADARRFREQLYAVLRAHIDQAEAPADATAALDRWIHRAWRDLRLDPHAPGSLSWPSTALDVRLPIKRAALSALDLLQHEAPDRLKRCAECGWLFADDTKNNSRRWCAMGTCGTSVKMRRYRAR